MVIGSGDRTLKVWSPKPRGVSVTAPPPNVGIRLWPVVSPGIHHIVACMSTKKMVNEKIKTMPPHRQGQSAVFPPFCSPSPPPLPPGKCRGTLTGHESSVDCCAVVNANPGVAVPPLSPTPFASPFREFLKPEGVQPASEQLPAGLRNPRVE